MLKEFLTSKITRKNLEKFVSQHGSDELTLDLGCANSPYSRYFNKRIGFDIKKGEGVDVVGDAHNLPFGDNKFDAILCTEVLEHLHSPQVAIAEMKRVLKKGGHLILSTRFIFPIHDAPDDFYRYTKYGLKYLFKEGWEILELEEEVNTKNTLAVLIQRIGYQANFKGGAFIKAAIFVLAKIIYFLPSLIKEQFSDINKIGNENNIMTSGYYLVCQKK